MTAEGQREVDEVMRRTLTEDGYDFCNFYATY